jgi:hypothetical protein
MNRARGIARVYPFWDGVSGESTEFPPRAFRSAGSSLALSHNGLVGPASPSSLPPSRFPAISPSLPTFSPRRAVLDDGAHLVIARADESLSKSIIKRRDPLPPPPPAPRAASATGDGTRGGRRVGVSQRLP